MLRRLDKNIRNKAAIAILLIVGMAVVQGDALSQTAEGSAQPWTHLDMNNDPDNFQFAIVSDRTGGHRIGVFQDAIDRLNLLQPEFVISVGDFIKGYTDDVDTLNKEWNEFQGIVSKIEMPFFYVPGNHDISNRLGSQVWKERFGRDYYHFVYKEVLFLCLNTEDIEDLEGDDESPHISEEQRDYALEALAENPDVRWTLVFFHTPIWDERETGGGDHDIGYWLDIERSLKARKHTVIAGHQHHYSYRERNNADYIVLSTTGGGSRLRGPLFGEFDHVVWVTMSDEGPRIANLMLSGIWDKKLSPKYFEASLRGRIIESRSYYFDDWFDKDIPNYPGSSVALLLTNTADIPMKLSIDFHSKGLIKVIPESLEQTVPANSVAKVDITLKTERPLGPDDMEEEDITYSWKARFELPYRDNAVEISGAYPLIK